MVGYIIGGLVLIFLAVVLAIALVIGISSILIALFLHKDDPKTPDSFVYVIGDDRKDVAYKDAERDGVLCIDIRDMRKALGLTESSKSADSVTFTAKSGNSVKFSDGNAIATVNGVCDVKMPAEAVVSSKICSVPIETVAYIFDGISVTLPDTGLIFILGKSGSGKSTLLNLIVFEFFITNLK